MQQRHYLLLAASLASASIFSAQPAGFGEAGPRHGGPGGPGGPGRPGRLPPLLRVLDADHDGEISATEIAGAATALRSLDANGDGSLSIDELRPVHPGRRPAPPADAPTPPTGALHRDDNRSRPISPVMLALDADGDGALSAAEINNAPASLRALDANGDGKLTRDELRPLPPLE